MSKLLSLRLLDVEKMRSLARWKMSEISEQTAQWSICHDKTSFSWQTYAYAGLDWLVQLADCHARCLSVRALLFRHEPKRPSSLKGCETVLPCSLHFISSRTTWQMKTADLLLSHLSSPLPAIGNLLSLIDPTSKTRADGGEASQWRPISLLPSLPCIGSLGIWAPSPSWTALNSEFQYLPGNVQCLANTTTRQSMQQQWTPFDLVGGFIFWKWAYSTGDKRWQKVQIGQNDREGTSDSLEKHWSTAGLKGTILTTLSRWGCKNKWINK